MNNWDVDIDGGWGAGWGCCHYGLGAAAVGAAAGYAAAEYWDDDYDDYYPYPVGSTVYTLPSNCTTTIINGITYQQCGDSVYEPQFVGGDVGYVVVDP